MRRGRPKGVVRSTVAKQSPKQPDPSGGKSAREGHAQKIKMPNNMLSNLFTILNTIGI